MSEVEIKKIIAETMNINLKSIVIAGSIGAAMGALIIKAFGI